MLSRIVAWSSIHYMIFQTYMYFNICIKVPIRLESYLKYNHPENWNFYYQKMAKTRIQSSQKIQKINRVLDCNTEFDQN